jgi:hypothetical protein
MKMNDFQYPRMLNKVWPRTGPTKNPSPLAALRYASPSSFFAPNLSNTIAYAITYMHVYPAPMMKFKMRHNKKNRIALSTM